MRSIGSDSGEPFVYAPGLAGRVIVLCGDRDAVKYRIFGVIR